MSVTLCWKDASEVGKVGNHYVGRLCLVDGVEGLQQLLIARGVSNYVCQNLVCVIASPSSLTVTLHCADQEYENTNTVPQHLK